MLVKLAQVTQSKKEDACWKDEGRRKADDERLAMRYVENGRQILPEGESRCGAGRFRHRA